MPKFPKNTGFKLPGIGSREINTPGNFRKSQKVEDVGYCDNTEFHMLPPGSSPLLARDDHHDTGWLIPPVDNPSFTGSVDTRKKWPTKGKEDDGGGDDGKFRCIDKGKASKRLFNIFLKRIEDTDEIFKQWVARNVEKSVPYFVGQHGNNYGQIAFIADITTGSAANPEAAGIHFMAHEPNNYQAYRAYTNVVIRGQQYAKAIGGLKFKNNAGYTFAVGSQMSLYKYVET
mgnify:CR=1 FL=1